MEEATRRAAACEAHCVATTRAVRENPSSASWHVALLQRAGVLQGTGRASTAPLVARLFLLTEDGVGDIPSFDGGDAVVLLATFRAAFAFHCLVLALSAAVSGDSAAVFSSVSRQVEDLLWNDIGPRLASDRATLIAALEWIAAPFGGDVSLHAMLSSTASRSAMACTSLDAQQSQASLGLEGWLGDAMARHDGDDDVSAAAAFAALRSQCGDPFWASDANRAAALVRLTSARFYDVCGDVLPLLASCRVPASAFFTADLQVLIFHILARFRDEPTVAVSGAPMRGPEPSPPRVGELVRRALAALVRSAVPGAHGTVGAVASWFAWVAPLLARDYSAAVLASAIDGDVLWSGLSRRDVFEMGIDDADDVCFVLQVLSGGPLPQ